MAVEQPEGTWCGKSNSRKIVLGLLQDADEKPPSAAFSGKD